MVSASSFETPSFTGLGAPSTRSLASFKPRLVTSRTALITLILFAPTSLRTTVNSVFSSAGAAAAAAPPPATITGAAAAADTPRRSSSFFTKAAASSSDKPTICSSSCCRSAMFFSNPWCYQLCRFRYPRARFPVRPGPNLRARQRRDSNGATPRLLITKTIKTVRAAQNREVGARAFPPAGRARRSSLHKSLRLFEFLLFHGLINHNRQVPADRIHSRHQPLRRSVQEEQKLRINLFLRRHGGQRLDLLDRD